MSIDEGYVKYTSLWTMGSAPDAALCELLETWRRPLFDAGLIGCYETSGIGFGNLSVRTAETRRFVISGTQTGHIRVTVPEHYALVTDYDIAANRVACTGPVQASSESMTHAAIYELSADIQAVVHVHSKRLWQCLLERIPTTRADVAYGTPGMAQEIARLYREGDLGRTGVAAMAGHEEGLISFGPTLAQAAQRMLELQHRID
jgi:ribulose-5-phosphate 4-epimerase/fuculose-1-phosphate aldolase